MLDGRARKASTKAARLPKAAQIALRALNDVLAECGEPAPASSHIPAGIQVTTIDRWRQYAYRSGISAGETPRARQMAFERASHQLVAAQAVGIWDQYAWAAR